MPTPADLRIPPFVSLMGAAALTLALLFSSPGGAADSIALAPDRDTSLFEDGDSVSYESNSNGIGKMLYAGETNGEGSRRSLLGFDIAGSAIPAGNMITSATLTLTVAREPYQSPAAPFFLLYRVTKSWGEGTSLARGGEGVPATLGDATWLANDFDPAGITTEFWTTPGGDYAVLVSDAGLELPGGPSDLWEFSGAKMVADVQLWLDSPEENHGWILFSDREGIPFTARAFHSREANVLADRPVLVVPEPGAAAMAGVALLVPAGLAYSRRCSTLRRNCQPMCLAPYE